MTVAAAAGAGAGATGPGAARAETAAAARPTSFRHGRTDGAQGLRFAPVTPNEHAQFLGRDLAHPADRDGYLHRPVLHMHGQVMAPFGRTVPPVGEGKTGRPGSNAGNHAGLPLGVAPLITGGQRPGARGFR
ncbi:hypothetical protein AB852_08910 [Streptomyces uncialis]|uniref:Uncharacterized protein n=1 Tax=Streptomyces uncialis TaxID=1048205 RepID=A0A1Q4V9E1_9ACTN|nr:hypothetical protein AB852_08910 [Streptomyces uncialis]